MVNFKYLICLVVLVYSSSLSAAVGKLILPDWVTDSSLYVICESVENMRSVSNKRKYMADKLDLYVYSNTNTIISTHDSFVDGFVEERTVASSVTIGKSVNADEMKYENNGSVVCAAVKKTNYEYKDSNGDVIW